MQPRRGEETRAKPTEPALRVIMRRLREIMAEPGDGQTRLDKIVRQIAGLMVAEVCSIYIRRQDGSLELFATEGLNPGAVHNTRLEKGEGLVGRCAELAVPINEPDAPTHPAFSYRPETGEEVYHSLLSVPILRAGQVLGVLVVQNKTKKVYSEEDVEILETTAMVVAEHIVSGAVAGAGVDINRSASATIAGEAISDGIALGHAVLHEPRIVVTRLIAEDPAAEQGRLDVALEGLRAQLDAMLAHEHLARAGEHRDVLEAYRMFADDRGWVRRLGEGVKEGLTAEASVERARNSARARMLRQNDPYWRERQRDLEDLSDRLLRMLVEASHPPVAPAELPPDTILVARSMGPAELLDYDRTRLRGLVVESAGGQSHVAIVAKALGIASVGHAEGVVERVNTGDAVIVDAETGEVHVRPPAEMVAAYADKVRFRARRQIRYLALRDVDPVTKDGEHIELNINAGLQVDMPHLQESGAAGVGLFRTELQFMLAATFPRLERQTQFYRAVVEQAAGKRIVFRTLDIGGDKILPYMHRVAEENPALGWRAIRMGLDRPGLLRTQVRALLRASAGRELSVMLPMVSEPSEMRAARALIDREIALAKERGNALPTSVRVGAMLEVPSLVLELDALLDHVDFLSIGSNDLMQFLFAADRNNSRLARRYDPLSLPMLRVLRMVVEGCRKRGVPVGLCGEMAGRPIEAMALIGLGLRSLSMAPSLVGPVKSMILSLESRRIAALVSELLEKGAPDVRARLERFAEGDSVEL